MITGSHNHWPVREGPALPTQVGVSTELGRTVTSGHPWEGLLALPYLVKGLVGVADHHQAKSRKQGSYSLNTAGVTRHPGTKSLKAQCSETRPLTHFKASSGAQIQVAAFWSGCQRHTRLQKAVWGPREVSLRRFLHGRVQALSWMGSLHPGPWLSVPAQCPFGGMAMPRPGTWIPP